MPSPDQRQATAAAANNVQRHDHGHRDRRSPQRQPLVSARKMVAINQGNEFIRFGVINLNTVTTANTVQSTQVADARIEYRGSGFTTSPTPYGLAAALLRGDHAVLRAAPCPVSPPSVTRRGRLPRRADLASGAVRCGRAHQGPRLGGWRARQPACRLRLVVVGLDGSGDQTTQTLHRAEHRDGMPGNLGVSLPPGTNLQLKNVAAVMVTANLPAFARPGQAIDVTVTRSATPRARKRRHLAMTPPKGADGQVCAIAQGNMAVGGAGAQGGGARWSSITCRPDASRAARPSSARSRPHSARATRCCSKLNDADFGTARRVVDAINLSVIRARRAPDGRSIQVRAPTDSSARVAFLGHIENLEVTPVQQAAKVIVNSRTGSVVMNQRVTLQNCAVAHGNLTVTVNIETQVSQPPPPRRTDGHPARRGRRRPGGRCALSTCAAAPTSPTW